MHRYELTVDGTLFRVDITDLGPNQYRVLLDGRSYEVTLTAAGEIERIAPLSAAVSAVPAAVPAAPTLPDAGAHAAPLNGDTVTAPMPGTVLSIAVSVGRRVSRGQPLLVLEAMKMNNSIGAPRDGVVRAILVEPGRNVGFGEALISLE